MELPKNHQTVMPYLMLEGAEQFIVFTQQVFNAAVVHLTERTEESAVMHAEIKIGDSTIMFSGATAQWTPQTAHLFIYVDNADETYKLALQNGAVNVMEPADRDYGRACGVQDPFSNTWWITSLLP
jgi:PhnB protein